MIARERDDESGPTRVVVMGVSGAGKSTVAEALARRLHLEYLDADDFHSPQSVAKMSAGEPLTDADRWPWLARIRKVLRERDNVVVACSALRRAYRDVLRAAGDVRFVLLDLDEATAVGRSERRDDHYMGVEMIASQFTTLERPDVEETDIAVVDARGTLDDVIAAVAASLAVVEPGTAAVAMIADGGADRSLTALELAGHARVLADRAVASGARRVLLVPPDHTRLHSGAGALTVALRDELRARECDVGVLPALGTHATMSQEDANLLFDGAIASGELLRHDWRTGLRHLGSISAEEIDVVTDGRYAQPVEIQLDEQVFDRWDLVVSIGQVVPHEVIGMANFTKNVVIGLGGAQTIHRSHFVGAVAGMERIMGRATSPVRDVVDAAFDRFIDPLVRVWWVLTVVEDTGAAMITRGLFAGEGGTGSSGGAAFRSAAALSLDVNVDIVDEAFGRVACWLDPREFRSTWLGNKAVYRTRMAIADGGELIVLAPGVVRFGEDDVVDDLIRRHGYRGTTAALDAVRDDSDVAANLGAAAHLIHGSSEGRFRIVYCTDPASGGLSADEIKSVGYEWRPLPEELERLGLVDDRGTSGPRRDRDGLPFQFIANPALGLWAVADRIGLTTR